MGGYGSGQQRWRNSGTVEETRELDLSQLRRAGCLEPGWHGRVPVTISGKVSDPVEIRVGFDHIDVSFQTCDARGKQHWTRQTVRLTRMRCRFGGYRPYFLCPGVDCGCRVTKLYWPHGGYVLCRHCHALVYVSQSDDEWDRAYLRANKIRRRLGAKSGSFSFDRPRGMHSRTFERLLDQFFKAEAKREERFALFEARFGARS